MLCKIRCSEYPETCKIRRSDELKTCKIRHSSLFFIFVRPEKITRLGCGHGISILLCGCLMARRVKGSLFIAIIRILSYVLIKMMVGKFKDLNPTLYILSVFLLFNYVFG